MGIRIFIVLLSVFGLVGCTNSFFENPQNYPTGTASSIFPDYDHFNPPPAAVVESPTAIVKEGMTLFEDIFSVTQIDQIKCHTGRTFQKFVDMYFLNADGKSPQIDFFCLTKFDEGDEEIEAILYEVPGLIWNILPPNNLFDTDLSVLKSLEITTDSTMRVTISSGATTVIWSGVKFNLTKKAVAGTPLSWVPERLLSFEVDHLEINDDGNFILKLRTSIGFPYSYSGVLHSLQIRGKTVQIKL